MILRGEGGWGEVKQPECKSDHFPSSVTEMKEAQSWTPIFPKALIM